MTLEMPITMMETLPLKIEMPAIAKSQPQPIDRKMSRTLRSEPMEKLTSRTMSSTERLMARMLSFLMREELPTAISGPPTNSAVTPGKASSISEMTPPRRASRRLLPAVSLLPKGEVIIPTARLISGVKM